VSNEVFKSTIVTWVFIISSNIKCHYSSQYKTILVHQYS